MTGDGLSSRFSLENFLAVRETLRGRIFETPLRHSNALSELSGNDVYLKIESFQHTHSFKIRGAFGALLAQLEEARQRGVVAGSSGNFAQGIAYACRELEIPVKVVMLEGSAPNKMAAAKDLGAEIVTCKGDFSDRGTKVERIEKEEGRLALSSFDQEGTILGNGSLALELLEQLPEVDVVAIPCSGGGILAGVAAVVKQVRPEAAVYGVQSEENPSMRVSLTAGAPTTVPAKPTIADGLIANCPGQITFDLVQLHVEDILLVSEEEIAGAVRLLLEEDKLIVEPSGATVIAALLRNLQGMSQNKKIALVLTGGNIDEKRLTEILELN